MPYTLPLAQSFQPSVQQWVLIAGFAVVFLIVLIARLRRRPLNGSPKQYSREIDSANRRTQQLHGGLEQLLAELETASGKITAKIEIEFARLSKTIEEADRRIAALRVLLEAANQSPDGRQQRELPSAQAPAASIIDPRQKRIYALADSGLSHSEIAQRLNESHGEIELILNLRDSSESVSHFGAATATR